MAQKWLLNVCGFVDFLNPPWFAYLVELNEFLTKFANKRMEFEKKHKNLSCRGVCHSLLSLSNSCSSLITFFKQDLAFHVDNVSSISWISILHVRKSIFMYHVATKLWDSSFNKLWWWTWIWNGEKRMTYT